MLDKAGSGKHRPGERPDTTSGLRFHSRPKAASTLFIGAGVAQSVEQLIRNQQVGGSIPLAGIHKQ